MMVQWSEGKYTDILTVNSNFPMEIPVARPLSTGEMKYLYCAGRSETGMSKIDLSSKPKMSTDMGHIISSSQLIQVSIFH